MPGHPELDRARVKLKHFRTFWDWDTHLVLVLPLQKDSCLLGLMILQNISTYIYISDGGIQEEISQGVGRIAGYLGLGKVIMFYDANNIQLSTTVEEVTDEDTASKYRDLALACHHYRW